ncbi:MAG TPA: DUF2779 domain-containing protein [bacterium]|nr:DUF2779 domain-containing protein [bacterium]
MIEPKNIKYGYEKLLTKSMFLKGVQCSKLFWHYCNEKKLFEDESITSQAFDQGKMAGDYAKKLFANGIEIDWNNGFDNGLHNSAESLKLDKPLFEPGFIFNQLFCRNDILLPVSKNRKTEKSHKADKSGDYVFDIIEVKSSTNVNEIHIFDIAFQKYCCEGAGLKIRKCFVMHINNKYERSGELDLDALFIKKDVTKEVDEIQQATEKLIIELLDMLIQKNAPKIKTGEQCFAPYQCPLFSEVCNEYAGTDYSIFQLRKSKKKAQEFANQGILELADIPDSVKLNKTHKIQVMTARSGKPHIDGKAISKFLKQLEYPLYILDFETFSTAVPLFDKLKPYMQVTFQYSLHIVNKLDKIRRILNILLQATATRVLKYWIHYMSI